MRTGLVALIVAGAASVGCGGNSAGAGDAAVDATLDAPDAALGPDVSVDAALDGNSCASCPSSLESLCTQADDGADCPPSLDSPGLYAWAQALIAPTLFHPPICVSFDQCPEMVALFFQQVDACGNKLPSGGQAFRFDATSKKLVAVTQTCNGFAIAHCQGASECIPARCMPNQNGYILDPSACPVLPDAGLADGGSNDGSIDAADQ